MAVIDPEQYCRELESYLCRKNDGHLIRIVGPAFERVSGWARDGVPLNVARAGIDRYFARYYRRGPRRRPVRIEFCEADVLDAFDTWRRAVGVSAAADGATGEAEASAPSGRRKPPLATHVDRVTARLTALRGSTQASGCIGDVLERLVRELDAMRPEAARSRGEARETLIARLAALDGTLMTAIDETLDDEGRDAADAEAHAALKPFRDRMAPDAYQRALAAARERSVRDRYQLPTIAYE